MQISDIYWCTIDGPKGKGCNATCSEFEDSDISDDVACVRSIFDEHQRLFGNGFHAWTTYEPYCKSITVSYIEECFSTVQNEIATSENKLTSISTVFFPSTTTKAIPAPFTHKRTPSPATTQKVTQRFTQPKKPAIFSTTTNRPGTAPITKQSSAETSTSNRLKIFDLYLSQYSTKKPQRYTIPQFTSTASPIRQSITLANQNYFFQSQIARVLNGTNLTSQSVANKFHHQPITSTSELSTSTVSTTNRPRILFRYSFSGTTTPKSQPPFQ